MVVGVHRRAVGVFARRRDAEAALHELKKSGFDMNRVSVVVQDADGDKDIAGAEVRERVGDKSDEGATVGAVTGGTLGGLTGLLVGLGTLAIPGIGPIMLAGATATALATTLAGAGIGAVAGSLLGGLIGLGIPEERARVYNDRVQRGQYLVILDGTDAEIAEAEKILHTSGIEEFGIYDHPNQTIATGIPSRGVGVRKHAVGYFSNLNNAESAINDLRRAGFPLSQITLLHQNSSRRDAFAGVDLRDRFDENRWRLPGDRHRFYNDIIHQGQYVIIVDGTDDEINHAAAILNRHGIQQWQVFDPEASPRADLYPNQTGIATPVSTAPLHRKRAIGVFSHRRDAEAAIGDLRDGGISLDHVSIIGKNASGDHMGGVGVNDSVDNTKADDGAKAGAVTGTALGGLGGLLVGLGTLAIPGVGPVLVGGAAATALATALTGAGIGAAAGSIAGALVGLGIPEKNAKIYNDRINRGDYLVIVDGTDAEVRRAEEILKRRHVEEFNIYDATDLDRPGDRSVVAEPAPLDRGIIAQPTPVVNTNVPLHRNKRAIGVFAHRRDAEAAIGDLRDNGISLDHVSIIGKNADHNVGGVSVNDRLDDNKADDGAKAGAVTGGALGGLGGLLVGLGTLAIPGVGPVLLGGAAATALATALTGGAIGAAAGGIAGALVGLGIPEKNAKIYNDRINRGDYLVIVDGTDAEVHRAEEILKRRHVEEFNIYDATDLDRPGDRGVVTQPTSVANTTQSNYVPSIDSDEPAVIIIDRRDETVS
ncbi:signal transduction histidine kinase LytS [Tolypothrix sp. NIES-4075]|uniref:general stress protein n=1 Tax=Tolypothrix sp. NIES-4075 TaxID=2005459 RepID=UPI000B5CA8F2|nr:general stress protein [Tolypothrix sp. NIES-4075]GAX44135.1 signal transduction histidine kinase LytS [Tolypothrix sp. NIES-4075]